MHKLLPAALAACLLLAACAAPAPEPTPAPAPPIPVPPTPAPPTPAAAPATRDGSLGTFFFYWYHCPEHECDVNQLSVTPPGWVAPLTRDGDPRDGTSYSSINYDWFEGELRDIAATGIDTVFPVSWGDHPHHWFRQDRLELLVQANGVLSQPLRIGMFIDTTAQQAMYSDFTNDTYRFGPDIARLPLSDPRSGYFFYDRHIKGFFERIPRDMWATVDGRPIIITYTALCCDNLELVGELWGAVKRAFARDFGVEPWLIIEDTWFTPAATAPGGELDPLDGAADARYAWGAALNGPATRTMGDYTVSSVGPGFDNRRITGITDPRHQPRERPPGGGPPTDGAFLRASLAAVPPTADLVLIETWNEWPESTAVARAAYRGRGGRPLPDTFYMDIVRRWWVGQARGS